MKKIIAMDEVGDFEKRKTGIRFMGGYVMNLEDYDAEAQRITDMLSETCRKFTEEVLSKDYDMVALFPCSIHGSTPTFFHKKINFEGTAENEEYDPVTDRPELADLKNRFKKQMEKVVMDYVREKKGTPYAYIDPYFSGDDADRDSAGTSNMVTESDGANFYERMATLALYNLVFHDVDWDAEDYCLEIATRTLNESDDKWKAMYEVYKPAHKKDQADANRIRITNTSTYKTAVSSMLYGGNVTKQHVKATYRFNVKSINYSLGAEPTPFLYLADIVCGYVRQCFTTQFGVSLKTTENRIHARGLKELCEKQGMRVRVYDRCDDIFRNMVRAVQSGEIDRYAECRHQIENGDFLYGDFYAQYWIPQLERKLEELLKDGEYAGEVLERFPAMVSRCEGYMGKEVRYEAGMSIAKELLRIMIGMDRYRGQKETLFRLYDVLLRGYNHRGAIDKTRECILECEKYKSAVGIEEYIAHTLRTIIFYFNGFEFESALDAGRKLENAVLLLKRIYADTYAVSTEVNRVIVDKEAGGSNYCLKLAGKLYSSIGQAYAFLGKKAEGCRYFKKALAEFERNSADYEITMSHLLQLFIASNDRQEYMAYSEGYFQSVDLRGQMESAFAKIERDGGFMLLVFMKAFEAFYAADPAYHEDMRELADRMAAFEDRKEHPWELIYKAWYGSMKQQGMGAEEPQCRKYFEKAVSCVKNADATILMIQAYMKIEERDMQSAETISGILSEPELKACERFMPGFQNMTPADVLKWFHGNLTYEYV